MGLFVTVIGKSKGESFYFSKKIIKIKDPFYEENIDRGYHFLINKEKSKLRIMEREKEKRRKKGSEKKGQGKEKLIPLGLTLSSATHLSYLSDVIASQL